MCSGTGSDADWYRNISATPAASVQVRNNVWVPGQRMLTDEQASSRFAEYEHAHPKTAERLLSSMGRSYDGTDAGTNSEFDAGNATFIFSEADDTLYYDANGFVADGYTAIATVADGVNVVAGDVTIE